MSPNVGSSHRSDILAFISGAPVVVTAAQENGPYCLVLELSRTYNYGSQGKITHKVLGCLEPPPEQGTDNRLKHTPSLSVEEAYLLLHELWPKEKDSGLAFIQEPTEMLSGDGGQ